MLYLPFGTNDRGRTYDRRIRNPLLYPLSYIRVYQGAVPHSPYGSVLRDGALCANDCCMRLFVWGAQDSNLHSSKGNPLFLLYHRAPSVCKAQFYIGMGFLRPVGRQTCCLRLL